MRMFALLSSLWLFASACQTPCKCECSCPSTLDDLAATGEPAVDFSYTLTVDHSQSLTNIGSEFDIVAFEINDDNFPPYQYNGIATLTLVHLHREDEEIISTEAAKIRLDELGMQPADVRHLRAFARAVPHPEPNLEVVALGSSWVNEYDGSSRFPVYQKREGKRIFGHDFSRGHWYRTSHFLGVRP